MAEKPLSVAIVGMGKMGLSHAAMLSVLAPGSLTALVEAQNAGHPTLRSLGLRMPIYDDAESLLAAHAVDAAIICTPTFTHTGLTKTFLERGVSVLVEKPLTESFAKSSELAELAMKKGAIAAVGYSIDYDPVFRKARELLRAGVIGRPLKYGAWLEHAEVLGPKRGWLFQKAKSGGGVVINPAPHLLYLMLDAFGFPKRLCANLRSVWTEVEDEASVELEYESGLKGLFKASWSVPEKPALELSLFVEGEHGTLAASDDDVLLELNRPSGNFSTGTHRLHRGELEKEADGFELAPAAHAANYFRQDKEFLDCVRAKAQPRNSFANTLQVDRLIDAIYRSKDGAWTS
ncbi:MAG: Gfo/Idh/MocA family oxidoreductase [Elusimicrobia bacterium]|nr:Gfo/Idh/MocA family oxidoreductase [Elusimicrobiota bacterium]